MVLDPNKIPEELEITARSDDEVIMGVRHKQFSIEGIQFHPESILTNEGPKIVKNWLNMEVERELKQSKSPSQVPGTK
ncbi:MAG: hypothetical protein U5K69_19415 [Balneolaceae bacterium]|nr:hypothetical protein [Balneolaceae bacterium]